MEIVIFFTFIAVCAIALVWASRKTSAETRLARRRRAGRNKSRAEKLVAPRDTTLAHKDQIWQNRRRHATSGVMHTNQFVPKSEDSGTPEYDGFSRRDRHHVREREAQVKEYQEEEITMTAMEYHSDKPVKSKKTAS